MPTTTYELKGCREAKNGCSEKRGKNYNFSLTSKAPSTTSVSFSTQTCSTMQSCGARTITSIFIDTTVHSKSSFWTACPSETAITVTIPGKELATCALLPATAIGPAYFFLSAGVSCTF